MVWLSQVFWAAGVPVGSGRGGAGAQDRFVLEMKI